MNLTDEFKKIIDEYNSKRETESGKIIFEKDSESYHFRKEFASWLTINSDLTIYSSYLDIIRRDDDLKKLLEIVRDEKLKRNELIWGVDKAVGWINGEISNYKEVLNFFRVKVNISRISIFHNDTELMLINPENFEIKKRNIFVGGFDEYIDTLYNILQSVLKGSNVFSIEERDDDDEYSLYNLFILDVDKFKKSKYVVFEDNSSLIKRDIVGAYNELYISDKYELGFSNRLYVENYYSDNFEDCIELINKENESIEKKVTDILLKDEYNISYEDVKISDKHNIIEIDTKYVKFIYKKEDKKLMASRVEDFEFDELSELSEDMEAIETEISKLL